MTPDDKKYWEAVTKSVILDASFPKISSPRAVLSVRGERYMRTTLDLHGYGLNDARFESVMFIKDAKKFKLKYVRIVTGLSGQIRREFPLWLENIPEIRRYEVLNGGGAFKIFLKKN